MATQTTYAETQPVGVAGQQATMIDAVIVSRTVETAAGIAFGAAVEQGTADKGVILFDGGTVYGITLLDRGAAGDGEFDQYESASVMLKGDVWATCVTGCSAGDGVFVRPSNGDLQDSNANSAVQIVGARWDTSAAAGAVAIIHLG